MFIQSKEFSNIIWPIYMPNLIFCLKRMSDKK